MECCQAYSSVSFVLVKCLAVCSFRFIFFLFSRSNGVPSFCVTMYSSSLIFEIIRVIHFVTDSP